MPSSKSILKYPLIVFLLITLIYCSEKEIETTVIEVVDSTSIMEKKLTFLALGDSYTIGESVSEGERWPLQLAKRLNEDLLNVDLPRIIAKTGWTTDELISAIIKEEITETVDLVSLLIGVNNQFRGYPIAQQEKEFEDLLKMALSFAGGDTSRIIVVSIPDYGVTPFGSNYDPEKIAKEIDEYNAINQRISEEYHVQYFNITPISRQATNNPDLIASDGLHPSGEMYSEWVDLIYANVKAIITGQ